MIPIKQQKQVITCLIHKDLDVLEIQKFLMFKSIFYGGKEMHNHNVFSVNIPLDFYSEDMTTFLVKVRTGGSCFGVLQGL